MLMFILAVPFDHSNLPWFMDLIYIPGSYAILFFTASDFTFTTRDIHNWTSCPLFGSASSSLLELFLCSSPAAYWTPTTWGVGWCSSFSVVSFGFFILFMEFSRQERWSGLPFPSPVDHIFLELSTMTPPSWVAIHDKTHSFIELHRAVIYVIILVSFLWFWLSFCLPSDG